MSQNKAEEGSVQDYQNKLAEQLRNQYAATEGVKRDGNELIIPEWMGFEEAAKTLTEHEKLMQEERVENFKFSCHPNDGLVCLARAIKKEFGNVVGAKNISFFGVQPPRTVAIPIGPNKTETVPYGNVKIPGVPVTLSIPGPRDAETFYYTVTYKRMYKPLVERIEELVRAEVEENSIFKGHAIDSEFNYLDVLGLDESKIIFPSTTRTQLDANIFTPIEKREECIAAGIPIKRGILLEGPFGTGKTLTALQAAKRCVENDWTFIQVRPEDDFVKSLEHAKRYQPACVFVEDIDIATESERNDDLNRILNTFDGMVAKDSELMVIVTTNRLENINRGMLRPGRLDAVIHLGPFDDEAIIEFVRRHTNDESGENLLSDELDEERVAAAAESYVPAFIAEGIARAKMYAVGRTGNDEGIEITTDDLVGAFEGLRPQYELMQQDAVVRSNTVDEAVQGAVQRALEGNSIEGHLDGGHAVTAELKTANEK